MINHTFKSPEEYKKFMDKNEQDLLNSKNSETLYFLLNFHANCGLSSYNEGNLDFFKEQDIKYQKFRQKAFELNLDLSKYPETLEELTK